MYATVVSEVSGSGRAWPESFRKVGNVDAAGDLFVRLNPEKLLLCLISALPGP
jgi:hypothetical protein